jgi:deoxycytidine triphosphate deaminase
LTAGFFRPQMPSEKGRKAMRIITDKEFKQVKEYRNCIVPFAEDNLTPAGIDLTIVGRCYNVTTGEEIDLDKGEILKMQHGDFVHVFTAERIKMPKNWFGMIYAKVSLAYRGLTHLGTKIDPGFDGKLLLTFRNDGNNVIELKKGDRVCNVAFFEIPEPERGYEPQALKIIVERLETPIGLRYALSDEDIVKLGKFYSRELIDFYRLFIEQFQDREDKLTRVTEKIDDFIRNMTYIAFATILAFVLSVALAVAYIVIPRVVP